MRDQSVDDVNIISRIKNGDKDVIPYLYSRYRQEFIKWAQFQFSIDDEVAKDIFQDVLLSFYNSIMNGRLSELSCDIKTYLFACAKNLALNEIKKKSRFDNFLDNNLKERVENEIIQQQTYSYNKILISKALEKIPEKCRKIITLYYFNEYDLDSISQEMDYKNANVVKKKKCECMKMFGEIVKDLHTKAKL